MLAFCLVASILTCMGRSFRAASSGFVYHVLNRGNARRKLFFKEGDYRAFLRVLTDAKKHAPMRLLAYRVMPNHWHPLCGPVDALAGGRVPRLVPARPAVVGALAGRREGRVILHRRSFLVVMAGLVLWTARFPARAEEVPPPGAAGQRVHFEADVVPILRAYCWKCHGGEGRAGGLDMRSLPLLLAGGKSGSAVNRGSADKSLLYQKLASGQMPPGKALKPTTAHLATLRTWLDTGQPRNTREGRSPGAKLRRSNRRTANGGHSGSQNVIRFQGRARKTACARRSTPSCSGDSKRKG